MDYDADDELDCEHEKGNRDYWCNPQSGYDNEHCTRNKKRWKAKEPRKSSSRCGKPQPPKLLPDFYNKFFWHGMNMSEDEDEGGRVMFGGTRGKFNGLDLFESVENNKRRKPRVPCSFLQ